MTRPMPPPDDFDWLDDVAAYAKDVPWRYAEVLMDEVRQSRDAVDYYAERAKRVTGLTEMLRWALMELGAEPQWTLQKDLQSAWGLLLESEEALS